MLTIKRDIPSVVRGATEDYAICDIGGMAEFADHKHRRHGGGATSWYGGMSYEEALAAVRTGDMSAVPDSDKVLSQVESLVPVAQAWEIVPAIEGGVPVVPLAIAGVPVDMLRFPARFFVEFKSQPEQAAMTVSRVFLATQLQCTQCHDDNWGKRLAGSVIPQAHPTGYPEYRLEWQSIGSLQRRLRGCIIGTRAEPYSYGAPEMVELELYLMWRARGMPMETPAVRQ